VWHVGVCRLWDYGRRVVEYDKLLVPELLEMDGIFIYLRVTYLLFLCLIKFFTVACWLLSRRLVLFLVD